MRNSQGTGELDQAIGNKDTKKIYNLLQQIKPLNREFLELITDRFAEMVSKWLPFIFIFSGEEFHYGSYNIHPRNGE